MRRRKRKPRDLVERFQSTCGWCGKHIPDDTEVYSGGGKARPGIDLTSYAGQVLPVRLVSAAKTVLIAVPGADSPARRDGHDLLYMTCSIECAAALRSAFQSDIEIGKELGLP
jgi:hypothetical protein